MGDWSRNVFRACGARKDRLDIRCRLVNWAVDGSDVLFLARRLIAKPLHRAPVFPLCWIIKVAQKLLYGLRERSLIRVHG